MWIYEKKLIHPVKISRPNVRMAKLIGNLIGGSAGETSAGLTYLNHRFFMPDEQTRAVLTDIGTEELSHVEMLQTMMRQSLKGAKKDDLIKYDMMGWVAEYGEGPFYADSNGAPWSSQYTPSTGDPIADLTHNMGAEQRARAGYNAAMRFCDDPDCMNALQFLREREIVHYQRFGEALEHVYDLQKAKKCF